MTTHVERGIAGRSVEVASDAQTDGWASVQMSRCERLKLTVYINNKLI